MQITVLTGGATSERAVAFASASQIVAALRGGARKHQVQVVDLAGGVLDEPAERELLGGAVGLTPPSVDAACCRRGSRSSSRYGTPRCSFSRCTVAPWKGARCKPCWT